MRKFPKLLLSLLCFVAAVGALAFMGYTMRLGLTANQRADQTIEMSNATIQSATDAANTLDAQLSNERDTNDYLEEVNANLQNATDDHAAHQSGSTQLCKKYGICASH